MKTTQRQAAACIKFNSFSGLLQAISPESNTQKWENFLKEKGHTITTFSYLPEELKTALKFSFAKK